MVKSNNSNSSQVEKVHIKYVNMAQVMRTPQLSLNLALVSI